MSDDEREIECEEHGHREPAFVCTHLTKGQGLGFNQAIDDDDPWALFPDAWCDSCEEIRDSEGGWTDRAQSAAAITTLCSACYLQRRLLNWPGATHAVEGELVRQSIEYLQQRQDALAREYRLADHERYDWNQDTGLLVFSNAGTAAVVAEFQFVGSLSTRTNTWLWSWANGSDREGVRSRMREVRAYGEEHRLLRLSCPYWSAVEEDGWEMAAVAAFLLKAKGVYRSPHDHMLSFLLITEIGRPH
jgi:hypothetical protein